MNRREFVSSGAATLLAGAFGPGRICASPSAPMALSPRFKRLKAPETERAVVQLTSGQSQCYPLYYFIPTITGDGRYLIYHKAAGGWG